MEPILVSPDPPPPLLVQTLDLAGYAVSAGAACSSGKVGPSHVLKAMGIEDVAGAVAIYPLPHQRVVKDLVPDLLQVNKCPDFVVNRGGEYCFMPGLPALRWLADLDT